MKMKSSKLYLLLFLLYISGPIFHDVIPAVKSIGMLQLFSILLMYLLGAIAIIPSVVILIRLEMKSIDVNPKLLLRFCVALCVSSVPYVFFWDDWNMFYISSALMMNLSVLLMVLCRKDLTNNYPLLMDSKTGSYYSVRNGKAHRLTEDEFKNFKAHSENQIKAIEFSSSSIPGFDCSAPMVPFDRTSFGISTSDYNAGFTINPASGLPMIGGASGLDVNGNSFGTNLNDSNSSYDSSRGY